MIALYHLLTILIPGGRSIRDLEDARVPVIVDSLTYIHQ